MRNLLIRRWRKGTRQKSEKWYPFLDTYRTLCLAPEPDFERILTEIRSLTAVA